MHLGSIGILSQAIENIACCEIDFFPSHIWVDVFTIVIRVRWLVQIHIEAINDLVSCGRLVFSIPINIVVFAVRILSPMRSFVIEIVIGSYWSCVYRRKAQNC